MCLAVCLQLCAHFYKYALPCSLSRKADTVHIQNMCLSACLHAGTKLQYIYYRFVYAYVCVVSNNRMLTLNVDTNLRKRLAI